MIDIPNVGLLRCLALCASLILAHRALVEHLAMESSCRIIDWAGDSCFLTCATPSAAVFFALRLQQSPREEPDLPDVRTGLHMGEVSEAAVRHSPPSATATLSACSDSSEGSLDAGLRGGPCLRPGCRISNDASPSSATSRGRFANAS